ncbi:MAG TPA: TonB-dependent receptor [Caulobacteraceae bacterium]|jgi:iron complex outermembrane receptor protein|nr:TonB-dependent receptor [Caulobacteraceae bacterium]
MSGQSGEIRRKLMLSSCALAIGLAMSGAALAQAAGAATSTPAASEVGTVGEIVVTAERRSTDIQKTPDAITALSEKQLEATFTTKLAGLNAEVPSLEITKASGFENLVAIRGIGSETPENSLTTVPGVSLFVDGVYIANSISLDQTLFDVHDIEVLRGPQGALYGQSSTGGAILINSNQPQLGVFSGSGDASFGNYNLYRERGEVNIPIGDTLALRISGQKYDHTGFTDDLALPNFRLDDAHDESLKLALLWQPVSNFSATLTAQIYHSDQHGDAQKNINDPAPNPWEVYQDYPGLFKLTTQLYHLNLQWDLPWFTIKSVTAYQGLDHVQQEDSSRSTFALLHTYDDVAAWNTHLHNYTEELDFLSKPGGKVDWIVGLFGLLQNSKQFVVEYECLQTPCPGPPTPEDLAIPPDITSPPYPSNLAYGNVSHVDHRSGSVFGQATYHVTNTISITGGVRGNWDYFRDNSFNFSAFTQSGGNTVLHTSSNSTPTWRIEVDDQFTPNNMVYASYSRGYKPGGVNGSYGQIVIPPVFLPETNDAFEIGSKNYFLDRTVRLNVAGYYYIQKNFQYIETDPVPFDAGISNIPLIHDYGIETEADYVSPNTRFTAGLTLALETGQVVGNYHSIDSTVANAILQTPQCFFGFNPACYPLVIAAAKNLNGATPPDMPHVSGALNFSYRFDVPGGTITPRVQITYRGSEWARIFNEPTLDKVPQYTVTDLNLEYAPNHSNLRISLTMTNIGSVAGINSRYIDPYGTGQVSDQYIPPFQVIGTVAYSF